MSELTESGALSRLGRGTLWLAGAVLLFFLLVPLVALVERAIEESSGLNQQSRETLSEALRLTLMTSGIALGLIVLFGTPLAYVLARRQIRGLRLIETLIDLPMVLPPAVAGLALLMAFGRNGLVGSYLNELGITLGFTTAAVILAQVFVSAPFYVRSARAGFIRVNVTLEEAASVLGASPLAVFRTVTFPLARAGLGAGAVLAWARAVGEFGATLIFAGNFPGVTQTMPLAIYGRYEAGDLETAMLLAVILLAASMFVLLAVRLFGGRATDLA